MKKIFYIILFLSINMIIAENKPKINFNTKNNYSFVAKTNFAKIHSSFNQEKQVTFHAKKNWWNKWGKKTAGIVGCSVFGGLLGAVAGNRVEWINPYMAIPMGITGGMLLGFAWQF